MGEALGILSSLSFGSSLTHKSLQDDPGSRQLCRCQGETGLPVGSSPNWALTCSQLQCRARVAYSPQAKPTQASNASVSP